MKTYQELFDVIRERRYPFNCNSWEWADNDKISHPGVTSTNGNISIRDLEPGRYIEVYFHKLNKKLVLQGDIQGYLVETGLFNFKNLFTDDQLMKAPCDQDIEEIAQKFGGSDPLPEDMAVAFAEG